jgi:hypothetical protein
MLIHIYILTHNWSYMYQYIYLYLGRKIPINQPRYEETLTAISSPEEEKNENQV